MESGSVGVAATIEDVARRAKVSVATVSRALRGLPNVAPSTRARVLAAARDLHYVVDPHASRLAAGRTMTIGLVTPRLGEWYHAKLFSGVERRLAASGYDLLPFTLSGPGGIERFLETLPFRKRVDGMLVVDTPLDDDLVRHVVDGGVQVLTVGWSSPLAPSLMVDNVASARLAVGHLTGLGHQRIALVGGGGGNAGRVSAADERRRGYREALHAAGLVPDPAVVVAAPLSLEGGAEGMHALLALDDHPTAVFACSDEVAIGALQVVRDTGLRVPDDLSMVGFDDHDVSEYLGLTTVRQDVVGLGERAADLMLAGLAGDLPPEARQQHPTRLIVRRTTGPPPPGIEYAW